MRNSPSFGQQYPHVLFHSFNLYFLLATCITHLQPKSPLVHFVHSHLVYLWLCPEMEPKNSQKLLGKLIINDKLRDFPQKPIWIGHDRAKKIARPDFHQTSSGAVSRLCSTFVLVLGKKRIRGLNQL